LRTTVAFHGGKLLVRLSYTWATRGRAHFFHRLGLMSKKTIMQQSMVPREGRGGYKTPAPTFDPCKVDYEHIRDIAENDTLHRKYCSWLPRDKCDFFGPNTPWCNLCQCRVTRPTAHWQDQTRIREEHCEDVTHTQNYNAYTTFFYESLQKHQTLHNRDQRSRSFHLCQARQRLEVIDEASGVTGSVMAWYDVPGDQVGLRNALVDLVFSRFLHWSLHHDVVKVVHRHVYYARVILCYRVAKSCLKERPSDAYTVGMLLVPYAC